MKKIITFITMAFLLILAGCDEGNGKTSSDAVQRQAQEQLSQASNMTVGMPAITQFSEKRMAKDIFELRDKMVPTITYIVDMNGGYHKLCDSVGFGLPYSTQFTNPQRVDRHEGQYGGGNVVVAQADPNGLFSPPSSDATWVLCVNPANGKAVPLYIENRIIVSPFPLK